MNGEKQRPEQQLYERWKARPGPATLTPLMKSVTPLIDKALRSYGFEGNPNVRSRAQVHVMGVLPRYNPSKASLRTFLTNELKRIQRFGPQQRFAIPIPEQAALDLKSVERHERELSYTLGRDPTWEELSDATGLSSRRVQAVKSKYGVPVLSETAFETPEGDISPPGVTGGLDPEDLWMEAVYGGLDPIDKKILDWSMGHHGQRQLTKTQMAANLNMSVSAITQRALRIARKLEEGREHRIL
jgi:DNA-directed RNA polymerase specialized sigma subunit